MPFRMLHLVETARDVKFPRNPAKFVVFNAVTPLLLLNVLLLLPFANTTPQLRFATKILAMR